MTTVRSNLRLLGLAAVLAVALSACGNDKPSSPVQTDESAVRKTVVDWYSAIARADGTMLCALLTPAARRASAQEGPSIVIENGKLQRIAATCAARTARQAQASVVDAGIAPGVDNAVVTKVEVLGDHANATARLGKGEQLIALTKLGTRWLVNGFPQ
jgi:hypothetical protein